NECSAPGNLENPFDGTISYRSQILDAKGDPIMFSAGVILVDDSANDIWKEINDLEYTGHTIFADMSPMMAELFDKTDDCTVSEAVQAMAAMGFEDSDDEAEAESATDTDFDNDWAPHGSKPAIICVMKEGGAPNVPSFYALRKMQAKLTRAGTPAATPPTPSPFLPTPSKSADDLANVIPTPQDTPQAHIASIRDIIGTARANKKHPTVNGYARINASLDVLESILKAGDYVATALTSFRADLIADLVAATSRSSTTSYSSVARSNPAPLPPAPSAPKAAPAAKNNEFVISLDKATDELLARPLPEIKAKVEAAAAATGVDKLKGVKLKGVKVPPRSSARRRQLGEDCYALEAVRSALDPTTGEKQPLSRPSLRACGQRSTPHLRPNLPQRRPRALCQQPLRHLQPFHHHCSSLVECKSALRP
ncbi:hypothetical protein B0H14DRAFT_3688226, partial [Mycena olivaceomarginata]